jgi:hypothetical protein
MIKSNKCGNFPQILSLSHPVAAQKDRALNGNIYETIA